MKIKKVLKQGQAALIVLLIVFVALGFGLSIISQSTTDVKISQQEEEASRAFNAAEAGIEEALKDITIGSFPLTVDDDIEVNYTVTDQTYLEGVYEENESAEVTLGGVNNTLTINWVDSSSNDENPNNCTGVSAESGQTAASLLITVIDNANQISRVGLNACSLSGDNGMTDISATGGDYLRSYGLDVTANDVKVRIRPIYNRVSLRVSGSTPLPVQTHLIDSTAQTLTQESKAIQVSRTEPATPSIFDYVLFSGTNIIK